MPFKKAQNMNWLKTENKDAFLKAVLPDKERIKLNFKRLTSGCRCHVSSRNGLICHELPRP